MEAAEHVIIPGLPNHLSLLILARLPFSVRSRLLCVSHACSQKPCPLLAIRKELNICEVWPVFISFEDGMFRFLMIDPVLNGIYREVFRPPPPGCDVCQDNYFYHFPPVAIDQSEILMAIQNEVDGVLHKFNTLSMDWKTLSTSPLTDEHCFASAASDGDGYVYVVGGLTFGKSEHTENVKSAKRLDTCTMQWEVLPDMIKYRAFAKGVMLHGCFCVVGGRYLDPEDEIEVNSGEIWDPINKEWTLVPELWPGNVLRDWPAPILSREAFRYEYPQVTLSQYAVVNDQLYALMPPNEVVYYKDATKEWSSLGLIVCKGFLQPNGIYGVGNELWVHCNEGGGHPHPAMIMATVPTLSEPLRWKIFNTSAFDDFFMPVFVPI